MSVAFLTMVWKDYWLLEHWIANCRIHTEAQNIYVLNHGNDPKIANIAAGCNVIAIPRETVQPDLTKFRWELLSGVTTGLNAFHDYVVCCDVDEFLILDGTDLSLEDFLSQSPSQDGVHGVVGLNVMPVTEDGPDGASLLETHPHAIVSDRYSKPAISSGEVQYTRGGHGVLFKSYQVLPQLLMLHLHYVTPDYQERMANRSALVEEALANAGDGDIPNRKRFWFNWARPDKILAKELDTFETARAVDCEPGFAPVAAFINDAIIKHRRSHLVRFQGDTRLKVKLPPRIRQLI